MPKILEEDDKSLKIETDAGAVHSVAKKNLSPGFLDTLKSSFGNAASSMSNAASNFGSAIQKANSLPADPAAPKSFAESLNKSAADTADLVARETGNEPVVEQLTPTQPLTLGEPSAPVAANGPMPASAMETKSDLPLSVENGARPKTPETVAPAAPRAKASGRDPFSSAFNKQEKAVQAAGELGAQKATEEYTYAKKAAELSEKFVADQQAREIEKQKQLDLAEVKRKEADDAVKNFKFQDFWADKSTGTRVMAAIASGLGAFSQAYNGHSATLDIINKTIERDTELQKQKFGQLKDVAQGADTAYGRIYARLQDKDLAAKQLHISSIAAVQSRIQEVASKFAAPEAKNKADQMLGELEVKKSQLVAEYNLKTQELAAKRVAEANKPATAEQKKAALFAKMMDGAQANFDSVTAKGYSRSDIKSAAGAKFLPEGLKSEQLKRQEQAEYAFTDGYIRATSGANAPEPEVRRSSNRFFPRAGDSKEVLQQKARDRSGALEEVKAMAGNSYRPLDSKDSGYTRVKLKSGQGGAVPNARIAEFLRDNPDAEVL